MRSDNSTFGNIAAALETILDRLRGARQPINVPQLAPIDYLKQAVEGYNKAVQSCGLTKVTPTQFAILARAAEAPGNLAVCRDVLEFLATKKSPKDVTLGLSHVKLLTRTLALTEKPCAADDVVKAIEGQVGLAVSAREQIGIVLDSTKVETAEALARANEEGSAKLAMLEELSQTAQETLAETKKQAEELKKNGLTNRYPPRK